MLYDEANYINKYIHYAGQDSYLLTNGRPSDPYIINEVYLLQHKTSTISDNIKIKG